MSVASLVFSTQGIWWRKKKKNPKRQAWHNKGNLANFIYLLLGSFDYLIYFITTGHVSRWKVLQVSRAGLRVDAQMPQLHVPMPNALAPALGQPWRIFNSGFLSLSTTDVWGLVILCCEDCPMHCRMFCRIPAAAARCMTVVPPFPAVTTKNAFRHCQISPGVKIASIENHGPDCSQG